MIQSKSDLRMYLAADAEISGYPKRNIASLFTCNPVTQFVRNLRKYEYYCNVPFSGIGALFNRFARKYYALRHQKLGIKLGFSIPPNTFGPGLYIPHHGTIVVNSNTKAGKCCVLHTCVCIAGSEPKVFGDATYFSTGAVISGSVQLGDNTTIGANSFVNKSFPEGNILLAGTPAKCIQARLPWYEVDGVEYSNRVKTIDILIRNHNLNGIDAEL